MAQTVAKYTESDNRLTLNIKFANGEHFRLNMSFGRVSVSSKSALNKADFATLARAMMKERENDSPVAHFARMKAFVEKHDSIQSAAASISEI